MRKRLLILAALAIPAIAQQQVPTVPNRSAQQYLCVPCPASTSFQQLIIVPAVGNTPAHIACAVYSAQFVASPTGTNGIFTLSLNIQSTSNGTPFATVVTASTPNAYPLPAGTTRCDVYVTGYRMQPGIDYNITGGNIVFVASAIPGAGNPSATPPTSPD